MTDPAVADAAADFEILRSRLFGIAYRILGGVFDAEDVVQDVWIRWQGTDRARVRDRVAFLVTVTTRIALNAATSSRARREVSVAGRLSERDFASADPAIEAERSEEFELAVHLLIERLPPVERAVYVLREAFDCPFRDIAKALGFSESNARQLAYRARRHLAEHDTTRSSRQTGPTPDVRDRMRQLFSITSPPLHSRPCTMPAARTHLMCTRRPSSLRKKTGVEPAVEAQ
ncbi:hypothetical protein GCM10010464_49870 [Pseudonocardia yunnanensis]|uniref:Sigma-70 family RNA polymerase sigma factor n=1 Tax=Pseudonocardia yunnanensis TaxID=58107 RepID=A0ABW4ETM7_9PSEU